MLKEGDIEFDKLEQGVTVVKDYHIGQTLIGNGPYV